MNYKHPVNQALHDRTTFGQKAAEALAKGMGSWRFLIIQTIIVGIWISLNTWLILTQQWDTYPFVLLNLAFSIQAAYTGPVLLIAANRSAERDRLLMEHEANEIELEQKLLDENTRLTREIHRLTVEVHRLATAASPVSSQTQSTGELPGPC
jgi:uncharacterized membrane protein